MLKACQSRVTEYHPSGKKLAELRNQLNPIKQGYWIARGVGWDNLVRRSRYLIEKKTGFLALRQQRLYRAEPNFDRSPEETCERWRERAARFFAIPRPCQIADLVDDAMWNDRVSAICQKALDGKSRLFGRWYAETGWPPDFNTDPKSRNAWPTDECWTRTASSGRNGDIKTVWDLSRLAIAYYFAREYTKNGDEKWCQAYWELIDSWIDQNPTGRTVAWGCSQETACRSMAILLASITFLDSPWTTPKRLTRIEKLLWKFGTRICSTLGYARSLKNNHSLSEAAGLFSIGTLFPEFAESERWTALAIQILQAECGRQIYSDGSYVQHSTNYHRVMLDNLIWVIALARKNNIPLPQRIISTFLKATEWLENIIDPENGRVPNCGANDGSQVLPLACSDYLDFRPTLQAAQAILQKRTLESGPWTELSLWIVGDLPKSRTKCSSPLENWSAEKGGFYVMRGSRSFSLCHAPSFVDRPSQCDVLNLDIWYGGTNIIRDAGSYRYYDPDLRLQEYFASTEAHNVVQIEDSEQMVKGPSFLWFCWPTVACQWENPNKLICRAQFRAGKRFEHSRTIERIKNCFRVTDIVSHPSGFTLRWRLSPEVQWTANETDASAFHLESATGKTPYSIRITSDEESRVSMGQGWESLYYGEKSPLPVIVAETTGQRIVTELGPSHEFKS